MQLNEQVTTMDTHTAGGPLRIITGGLPPVPGQTILEKRTYFQKHWDDIRRRFMYEPRGHEGMYGCVVTPPAREGSDFGVLFMHNEGFSTMCGHGIIGVVTALIETGYFKDEKNQSRFVIDTPAGMVVARAEREGTEVESVSFENVPSFVYETDIPISVCGKELKVHVSFGGAFYAIVQAQDLGVHVSIDQTAALKDLGFQIKKQVESKLNVEHPLEPALHGIYGTIICDNPGKVGSDRRNVTVFADQQIDRSPCGTGTCAQLALAYHQGKLNLKQAYVTESIINSQLSGRVLSDMNLGSYQAVLPEVKGNAFITGFHQFIVDPTDPLREGFLLK